MSEPTRDHINPPRRGPSIITILAILAAVSLICPAGYMLTEHARIAGERDERRAMLSEAMRVANLVPKEALLAAQRLGPQRLAGHKSVLACLERESAVRPSVAHIALFVKRKGEVVCLACTAPNSTGNATEPYTPYPRVPQEITAAFETIRPALTHAYEHGAGRVIAGVAPVLGPGGRVAAVVVVGENAAAVEGRLKRIWITGLVLTALACVVAVGWALLMDRNGRLTDRNQLLEQEIQWEQEIEQRLRESEDRFRCLFDSTFEGVLVHDGETVLEANQSVADMFGCAVEDIVGRPWIDFVAEDRRADVSARIKTGETGPYESRGLRPDGSTFPTEVAAREVLYEGRPVRVVTMRDITARRKLERSLAKMAFLDELTGLYNRRGFMTVGDQQLRAAKRRKSGAALFYADVDNLKDINDRHGHPVGDQAIAAVAEVLKRCFRQSDVLARVGGDEFAVLAVDCGRDAIARIIETAYRAMTQYNTESDVPCDVGFSMGATWFGPDDASGVRDLMRSADAAMYDEKRRRKLAQASSAEQGAG